MNSIAAFLTALLLGASAQIPAAALPAAMPSQVAAPSQTVRLLSAPVSVDTRINDWLEQLSREAGFEAWGDDAVEWRKYPLGPGQHGWVVLIHDAEAHDIGYMVVLAAPNGEGYILEEYGLGEMPLFSMRTLSWALSVSGDALERESFSGDAEVERLYLDAAHAFWKVSENGATGYVDAKTGVWLPISDEEAAFALSKIQVDRPVVQDARIADSAHIIKEAADPYTDLTWVGAPDEAVHDWSDFVLVAEERAGNLVYAANSFNGKAVTPIGVAGYHWWGEAGALNGYVALEQDGHRYVRLERLLQSGTFR